MAKGMWCGDGMPIPRKVKRSLHRLKREQEDGAMPVTVIPPTVKLSLHALKTKTKRMNKARNKVRNTTIKWMRAVQYAFTAFD